MLENELRKNLDAVKERIKTAAQSANRKSDEIKLIAVSKTHSVETLSAALGAGASDFGENKVQEAEAKFAQLGREQVCWHLIGNLQANKARKAVKLFDWIHTLDSLDLAVRLERLCAEENRAELNVLLQVNLANEATKSGASEKEILPIAEFLQTCRYLKLRGLMIIPPFDEDAERVRPFFRRLREMRDEMQSRGVFGDARGELSMGMSGDFEAAIAEGSTMVRVGTAIFGKRNSFNSGI